MGLGKSRIIEIDALRGIAIVLMVIFHTLWDLNFVGLISINLYSGPQAAFAYSIGTLFLLLVGVSLTLSYSRAVLTMSQSNLRLKYLSRGLRLLALGALITIATWLFLGDGYIIFGVISCIGLSVIFAYPFIDRPMLALCLGATVVLVGAVLQQFTFSTDWLLWLGFIPADFYSVDYFPILPWFGVVLMGVAVGNRVYGSKPVSRVRKETNLLRSLAFLGRHSLVIYIIHQPLILGILLLLTAK